MGGAMNTDSERNPKLDLDAVRAALASYVSDVNRGVEPRIFKFTPDLNVFKKRTSRCFRCLGHREVQCLQTKEHPSGYVKCWHCGGSGYGESIEEYWARKGITPDFGKNPDQPK